MTFANYVIDRLAWLLLLCFALLLSVLGMLIARVPLGVLILILGVIALITVLVLVADYLRIRSFYRELSDLSRSLSSQAYLCSTLTSSPHTREQAFVLSLMKTMTQAMVSQIEKTKQEQGDYRQYTELWVHEIKTPLAACELLLRNSDVPLQAGEMSLQAGDCMPAGERAQAGECEQAGDFSFSATASVNQRLGLQIKRIEELVDQTLYYARSGNLENDFIIKNIQLDQVVKAAIHRYSRHMILAKVYPRLSNLNVNVRGDAKWVQFMIEQIISNAIKYRKPQTEASYIDISATQQTNDFGVKTTVLSIRDEGIGIPASDCSRVFEQAFTGENGRAYAKSTGIGLFLVDKLARKMNMSVRLSSQVGKGTTVCLCFSSALHDVM